MWRLLSVSIKGKEVKERALVTAICKILYIYNTNLNAYHKIVGIQLKTAGTSKAVITKFSKLYDSVAYNTITNVLNVFATEAKSKLYELCSQVHQQAGDNLDVRSKVRFELGGMSYHDVHMYNNMAYSIRIPVEGLSTVPPPEFNIEDIDFSKFLLSAEEEVELFELATHCILTTWKLLPALKSMRVGRPQMKYATEMSKISKKVKCHTFQRFHAFVDKQPLQILCHDTIIVL